MSWDRIRGQDAARESFRSAFANGRLGQAYLFVGPDGVGKRLFARELAKALLCEKPPEPLTACGHCPGCAQVEVGTHPDFHTLRTPEGRHELPVADMRAYCELLARKPSRGGRVVGIVEDADDFNVESANSFLKALEEPQPGAILLLIATDTNRQLPTILSRCQIVRFAPLGPADLAAILVEKGQGGLTRRDRLIRLAGGSAARAFALGDDSIWQIRDDLVTGVTTDRPNFGRLAEAWFRFVEAAGKDTADQRLRTSIVLGFLLDALRQALRLAVGSGVAGVEPAEEAQLRTFGERLGDERLLELIDHLLEAEMRVGRRVQWQLVVETVLEQLTRREKAA